MITDLKHPAVAAIDISEAIPIPGGEDPPPQFTPYEADYFLVGNGDVVSHDPHLNTDGEALYRFLLSQSTTPPSYRLHCRGTHTETRTRWVTHEHHGKYESRHESYTETITDFDFYIDIGQHIVHPAASSAAPVMWSVADAEPAYRGGMVREVLVTDINGSRKREATSEEIKAHKRWVQDRTARGMPPWMTTVQGWQWREGMPDIQGDRASVLRSSKTLREWADEYCASPKHLKEFVFEKVLYGWNIQELENAVRSTIAMAPYSGNIHVSFKVHGSKVYIRPDNALSRTLSRKWVRFILWILLIYPFIWLFKRFHSMGGGRWQVCGGAYALKRWLPVDSNDNLGEPSGGLDVKAPGQVARESPRTIQTPSGVRQLVGVREGEWFKQWQPTIMRAITHRYQSSTPLYLPDASAAGNLLDGF